VYQEVSTGAPTPTPTSATGLPGGPQGPPGSTAGAPVAAVAAESILELRNIGKQFPNVRALDDVSLDFRPGEVLALIGENGAGKSTMLRILNGDYQPDQGEIVHNGKLVRFPSPSESHAAGVRVIYQEPELAPGVSVAENIYLGELPRRGRFVDWVGLRHKVQAQIDDFGFGSVLNQNMLGQDLSPAQRQLVEILKAMKSNVKVLALDEPTSSLADEEVTRLFNIVEKLRKQGVAIIYVSHRIREILRLADRVAVLRDGHLVAIRPAAQTSEAELVRLMVGRPLNAMFDHDSHVKSEVVLKVEGLTNVYVKNVSFEAYRGEVLGIAGLIGAGRTELAKTLFGDIPHDSGRVWVQGKEIRLKSPRDAMAAGIGFAPEDRKAEALLLERSVRENVSLAILNRISNIRMVSAIKERRIVAEMVDRLQVKTPSIEQEVRKLSGGNQQKVVLARWLARKPAILILDEPTRGIDVGAKSEIYQFVARLASEGVTIIFISSELPEVLGLCDRIQVMQAGRVTGIVPAAGATEESVLGLAIGDHLTATSEMAGTVSGTQAGKGAVG
jgi:L-arabinose transport system ATP-binding protein